MKKTSVIIGVFMPLFFCLNLFAFEVVKNACPQSVIIVSEKPSETVVFAAMELQTYIEKATGIKLQILKENETIPPLLNKIYIGETKRSLQNKLNADSLPENSYRIKIDDTEMFLYGKDGTGMMPKNLDTATWQSQLGTLYAVYDLLDRDIGVKWLWPGDVGTYVPHISQLVFYRAIDRILTPRLKFSRIRVLPFTDGKLTLSDEELQSYITKTREWLCHHRLGQYTNPNYGHGFTQYWKNFGEIHPEWFAMKPDGTRGPHDNRVELVQMCVSNPELHKHIVADWLKKRSQEKPWINCQENDKRALDLPCSCKNCLAWDANAKLTVDDQIWEPVNIPGSNRVAVPKNEKSLSDRYAKFYIAVQEEAKKYDKNAKIAAYAYSGYSEPPINTMLNENINIWIVPPYTLPLPANKKNEFKKLWDGWRKTGVNLILRPNYFHSGYCMPYIFAEEFGNEFKYALENGLIATDFDSLTSMWGTQSPNLYMLGRLHSRPDLAVNQILDEYYSAFGEGKQLIKKYFSLWEDRTSKLHSNPTYGSWLFKYADEFCTLEDIQDGKKLLDQAKLVIGDDKDAIARVDFLAKGLEHTRLLIDSIKKGRTWRDNPFDTEVTKSFELSLDELYKYRNIVSKDIVINPLRCKEEERLDFIHKSYFTLMLRTIAGRMPLNDWKFKWQHPDKTTDFAEITAEDMSSWSKIEVDKTWVMQAEKIGFENGQEKIGWYHTRFSLPDDKKTPYNYICIMFGGVDKSATVWLNGEKKLERIFYSRFDPDMWQSPFFIVLKKTECKPDNSLTVKVQGRIQGGGIWKSVYLIWYR